MVVVSLVADSGLPEIYRMVLVVVFLLGSFSVVPVAVSLADKGSLHSGVHPRPMVHLSICQEKHQCLSSTDARPYVEVAGFKAAAFFFGWGVVGFCRRLEAEKGKRCASLFIQFEREARYEVSARPPGIFLGMRQEGGKPTFLLVAERRRLRVCRNHFGSRL